MADRLPRADVPTYIAWVPMLRAEERHVRRATQVSVDGRARHYWDGHGVLLSEFQKVLSISEPAWDIYMVYDKQARWDEAPPPAPSFWMHQLGSRIAAPELDTGVFVDRVEAERVS